MSPADRPGSPAQAYRYVLTTPDGPWADFARWMIRQFEAWQEHGPHPDHRWDHWRYPGPRVTA